VRAIREIVCEVEAAWERQLGPRRFAHLRDLLGQLNARASQPHAAQPHSAQGN
jgi:hypothetical protein